MPLSPPTDLVGFAFPDSEILDLSIFVIGTNSENLNDIKTALTKYHVFIQPHLNVESFLNDIPSQNLCGCILLDSVFLSIKENNVFKRLSDLVWPIIFLIQKNHIHFAIHGIRSGFAINLLIKPIDHGQLIKCIKDGIKQYQVRLHQKIEKQKILDSFNTLTSRENQIMNLVCLGFSTKEISKKIHISIKTVEIHRSRILKKMKVKNSLHLARLLFETRLFDISHPNYSDMEQDECTTSDLDPLNLEQDECIK